jgi:addiction module HigA family antidote
MAIDRKALDAGQVDLSTVTTGRRLGPIHPGRVLREEFLNPLGLTAYRLAKEIRVPANRVTAILLKRRAVSADTALRFGRYFGTSPEFWLGLQEAHDLDVARREMKKELPTIKPHLIQAAE